MDNGERQIWVISAVIEATSADAEAAQEAIARALCPDDMHPGPCPVPWTTMTVRFEDLDEEQRRLWQESFDEDRRAQARADLAQSRADADQSPTDADQSRVDGDDH